MSAHAYTEQQLWPQSLRDLTHFVVDPRLGAAAARGSGVAPAACGLRRWEGNVLSAEIAAKPAKPFHSGVWLGLSRRHLRLAWIVAGLERSGILNDADVVKWQTQGTQKSKNGPFRALLCDASNTQETIGIIGRNAYSHGPAEVIRD